MQKDEFPMVRDSESSLDSRVWGRGENLRRAEAKATRNAPLTLRSFPTGTPGKVHIVKHFSYLFLNGYSTLKSQDGKRRNNAHYTRFSFLLSCGEERPISQEVYCQM